MNKYSLILGDCIEKLREMPDKSVDCIITDPPYGLGDAVTKKNDYLTYDDTKDNLIELIKNFMPEALRIANRVAITSGVKNLHLYPQPTWTMCWVNKAGTGCSAWGFCCWQPILVYGKDPFLADGKGRQPDTYFQRENIVDKNAHPCVKPTNVMEWIINRVSREGETILDPFMGSGTTGVACTRTKRDFIGIEQDKTYFNIAEDRISNSQLPLL